MNLNLENRNKIVNKLNIKINKIERIKKLVDNLESKLFDQKGGRHYPIMQPIPHPMMPMMPIIPQTILPYRQINLIPNNYNLEERRRPETTNESRICNSNCDCEELKNEIEYLKNIIKNYGKENKCDCKREISRLKKENNCEELEREISRLKKENNCEELEREISKLNNIIKNYKKENNCEELEREISRLKKENNDNYEKFKKENYDNCEKLQREVTRLKNKLEGLTILLN
jgi:hypothetical protein